MFQVGLLSASKTIRCHIFTTPVPKEAEKDDREDADEMEMDHVWSTVFTHHILTTPVVKEESDDKNDIMGWIGSGLVNRQYPDRNHMDNDDKVW